MSSIKETHFSYLTGAFHCFAALHNHRKIDAWVMSIKPLLSSDIESCVWFWTSYNIWQNFIWTLFGALMSYAEHYWECSSGFLIDMPFVFTTWYCLQYSELVAINHAYPLLQNRLLQGSLLFENYMQFSQFRAALCYKEIISPDACFSYWSLSKGSIKLHLEPSCRVAFFAICGRAQGWLLNSHEMYHKTKPVQMKQYKGKK